MSHRPASILFSVLGIIASGLCGGIVGWWIVGQLGWSCVGGALVAAFIGMVIATGAWIGLTSLLRALRLLQ